MRWSPPALLNDLERDTERAIDEGYSANLVVHAFARTARAAGFGTELTEPFFASMRMDLSATEHDEESFARYVYGSAEVVGLMCLRVFLQRRGPRRRTRVLGRRARDARGGRARARRGVPEGQLPARPRAPTSRRSGAATSPASTSRASPTPEGPRCSTTSTPTSRSPRAVLPLLPAQLAPRRRARARPLRRAVAPHPRDPGIRTRPHARARARPRETARSRRCGDAAREGPHEPARSSSAGGSRGSPPRPCSRARATR